MDQLTEIANGLWSFPIILPNNPLKWLNCYAIKARDGGRNLLIDTGFDKAECRADLFAGMDALGLEPEKTDVFLTHIHSDHIGNAAALQRLGCRMIMGKTDFELLSVGETERWAAGKRRAAAEGMPIEELELACRLDRSLIFSSGPIEAETVKEGDTLHYGGFHFQCVETPGHSPGHMCLYEPRGKIMLLGDHVLFDITPNICAWSSRADSLGDYMKSLEKTAFYDIAVPLPGHRGMAREALRSRVSALLEHHRQRLSEAETLIRESRGLSAYETAARMSWKIRAQDWREFPVTQKYFALSETLAHLDHLLKKGRILRAAEENGEIRYYPQIY